MYTHVSKCKNDKIKNLKEENESNLVMILLKDAGIICQNTGSWYNHYGGNLFIYTKITVVYSL
jgi:hypothetical protein